MAGTLTQETLRAVQDAFQVYKAIRCRHASSAAMGGVFQESFCARGAERCKSWAGSAGGLGMAGHSAVVRTVELEVDVLVLRCWVGAGDVPE